MFSLELEPPPTNPPNLLPLEVGLKGEVIEGIATRVDLMFYLKEAKLGFRHWLLRAPYTAFAESKIGEASRWRNFQKPVKSTFENLCFGVHIFLECY